jgi:hypothetical protein
MAATHCPHCENLLSKKSFNAHKRLYYDEETHQWIKRGKLTTHDDRSLLSETEHAIERFDFDANFTNSKSSSNSAENLSNDFEREIPPPYIDFADVEGDIHEQGEHMHVIPVNIDWSRSACLWLCNAYAMQAFLVSHFRGSLASQPSALAVARTCASGSRSGLLLQAGQR